MKVRETSGITSEYTGIEIGKTQNHYVAARAARKRSSRKLQQGGLSNGLVSPENTEGEEGRRARGREGKEQGERMGWRNGAARKQQGGLNSLTFRQ